MKYLLKTCLHAGNVFIGIVLTVLVSKILWVFKIWEIARMFIFAGCVVALFVLFYALAYFIDNLFE